MKKILLALIMIVNLALFAQKDQLKTLKFKKKKCQLLQILRNTKKPCLY